MGRRNNLLVSLKALPLLLLCAGVKYRATLNMLLLCFWTKWCLCGKSDLKSRFNLSSLAVLVLFGLNNMCAQGVALQQGLICRVCGRRELGSMLVSFFTLFMMTWNGASAYHSLIIIYINMYLLFFSCMMSDVQGWGKIWSGYTANVTPVQISVLAGNFCTYIATISLYATVLLPCSLDCEVSTTYLKVDPVKTVIWGLRAIARDFYHK